MENKAKNFLQSAEWRKFQESVGRKTYSIPGDFFSASIIKHQLPLVGTYLYIPKGPVMPISNFKPASPAGGFPISNEFSNSNDKILNEFKINFSELIKLAKENKAGWIRIDPENKEILETIKNSTDYKICKAPHDMQPKEIFVIDISKSEEDLLAEMKQKTRYNIRLAEKKNVKIFVSKEEKNVQRFCELVKITAKRDKVSAHSENYYRKMIEVLPADMLKIYLAEYEDKIIAANLVVFHPHTKEIADASSYINNKTDEIKNTCHAENFGVGVYGDTVIYLHGASDNEHRNVMAPYLLQWQAILDAKNAGYSKYDFGGVKMSGGWEGITKFKLGFSPNTKPVVFPGSYDIIVNPRVYLLYQVLQKVKVLIYKIRK